MGCGISSPAPDVPAVPALPSTEAAIPSTDGTVRSLPVVQADPAPVPVPEALGAGATNVTKVEEIVALSMNGLTASISALKAAGEAMDFDNPIIVTAMRLLEEGSEIMKTVANVALPPPGGTVLAAVLTLAFTVIKASRNVATCRELATKCAEIMMHIVEHRETLMNRSSALKADLTKFEGLTSEIKEFVDSVVIEGWAKRMANWATTSKQLDEFATALQDMVQCLGLGITMDTHSMVAAADAERQKLDKAIAEFPGGVDALIDDEEALAKFNSLLGGADKLLLATNKQMMAALKEMKLKCAPGPHNSLYNEVLKTVWANVGTGKEKISWNMFLNCFPSKVVTTKDIMLELQGELDGSGREAFKGAIDCDSDYENVSVSELNKVFPDGSHRHLLDQVKFLKESFRTKSISNTLGPEPAHLLRSRDTEVAQVVDLLHEGQRLIFVIGGPGEGKTTVAVKAVYEWQRMYDVKGSSYQCDMNKATTKDNVESIITETLCKIVKAGSTVSNLRAKLTQLDAAAHPIIVMLTNCEAIDAKESSEETKLAFQETLSLMLELVPKMQIILTSRRAFELPALQCAAAKQVALSTFSIGSAVALLQHRVPQLTASDGVIIAGKLSCNPHMVDVVACLLAKNFERVEELKDEEDTLDWMDCVGDFDGDVKKDVKKLYESVKRSLAFLEVKVLPILYGLTIFPSDFSAESMVQVLGVPLVPKSLTSRKVILESLQKNHLIQASSESGRYSVAPLVRDYLRFMLKHSDKSSSDQRTFSKELELSTKINFVKYSCSSVKEAFKDYVISPQTVFNIMAQKHKLDVQQALAIGVADVDVARECKASYLEMLPLLPYVNVYSNVEVQKLCKELAERYGSGEPVAQGYCLAVGSLFYVNNDASFTEALQMAETAKGLLQSVTTPKDKLLLAMALRAEGLIQREKGDYPRSIAVHREGLEAIEAGSVYSDASVQKQGEMERIILLAELAGTMDYDGQFEEGRQVAEKAVAAAEIMFRSSLSLTNHPVLALCLTADGYHANAQGRAAATGDSETCKAADPKAARDYFNVALEMHKRAHSMRHAVLGREHEETAISLNQMAISLQELDEFADSEKYFLESLQIRKNCLSETDLMVANTYHQLAILYMKWGKLAADSNDASAPSAESALRSTLSIRVAKLKAGHEKIVLASNDLAVVLRQLGREDEATALELQHASAASPP